MNEEVFRKKSLDKITSPEQMDACLKVVNAPLWLAIVAAVVFIVGILIWGILGKVETRIYASASSDGKLITCILPDEHDSVEVGQNVRIDDLEYQISEISVDEHGNSTAVIEYSIPEGSYDAIIVTDIIKPITFLLN